MNGEQTQKETPTTDPVSHSPGPWEFILGATNGQENGAHGTICEASEGRYYIASIWADVEELKDRADANARLIAAAPDMYAALKLVRRLWAKDDDFQESHVIDAAIAKAEGRSNG